MNIGKIGSLVAASALAATALIAIPPAAASNGSLGVKAQARQAVTHDATVFAATYAQARKDGLSKNTSIKRGISAISKIKAHPFARYISFGKGKGAISVDNFDIPLPPNAVSFCIDINLALLDKGYDPIAVSKAKSGEMAGIDGSSTSCAPI